MRAFGELVPLLKVLALMECLWSFGLARRQPRMTHFVLSGSVSLHIAKRRARNERSTGKTRPQLVIFMTCCFSKTLLCVGFLLVCATLFVGFLVLVLFGPCAFRGFWWFKASAQIDPKTRTVRTRNPLKRNPTPPPPPKPGQYPPSNTKPT